MIYAQTNVRGAPLSSANRRPDGPAARTNAPLRRLLTVPASSRHEHQLAADVAALARPVRVGRAVERERLGDRQAELALLEPGRGFVQRAGRAAFGATRDLRAQLGGA